MAPSLTRLALIPAAGLTTMEIGLYHSVDLISDVWGDGVAFSVIGLSVLTFDLLTAAHVAGSFQKERLSYGVKLSATVWGLQLPL